MARYFLKHLDHDFSPSKSSHLDFVLIPATIHSIDESGLMPHSMPSLGILFVPHVLRLSLDREHYILHSNVVQWLAKYLPWSLIADQVKETHRRSSLSFTLALVLACLTLCRIIESLLQSWRWHYIHGTLSALPQRMDDISKAIHETTRGIHSMRMWIDDEE